MLLQLRKRGQISNSNVCAICHSPEGCTYVKANVKGHTCAITFAFPCKNQTVLPIEPKTQSEGLVFHKQSAVNTLSNMRRRERTLCARLILNRKISKSRIRACRYQCSDR